MQYCQRLLSRQPYRVLLEQGAYLDERRYGDCQVLLFAFEPYYAEVFFDLHSVEISASRYIASTDILTPQNTAMGNCRRSGTLETKKPAEGRPYCYVSSPGKGANKPKLQK